MKDWLCIPWNKLSYAERKNYTAELTRYLAARGYCLQLRTWGFGKKKEKILGCFPVKSKTGSRL